MKVWKKLQNPFALVGQGFVVGSLLFWTTQANTAPRPAVDAAAPASILSGVQGAR